MRRLFLVVLGLIIILTSCGVPSGNATAAKPTEEMKIAETIPEIQDSREQAQKNGTYAFVRGNLKMYLPTYYTSPSPNKNGIYFELDYSKTDKAICGIISEVLSDNIPDPNEKNLKDFHEGVISALGGEIENSVKVELPKGFADATAFRSVARVPDGQIDQYILYDIYSDKEDKIWILLLGTVRGNKYAYTSDFDEILSTLKITTEEDTNLATLNHESESSENRSDVSDNSEAKTEDSSSSDIRKAIDSYEAFFDEYIAFMEKYKRNPSDLQLLADYMKFVDQYEKTMNELDALNDTDMSAADREYYLDAMNRINKKLLDAMD